MTVKHLRQLQRQQVTQAIEHDPTVASKYKAGVNECANEVVRYLGSLPGVDETVREKLINHLGNVVTSVNSHAPENRQCSQPLNVQIPQHLNQIPVVPAGSLLMPANIPASPLMIQSNTPSVLYSTSGHTRAPSTSPVQHGDHVNTQICGSFQIVPSSSASGAVALYLGQSQTEGPVSDSLNQAIPLYSHTPPRTKASMKAFDESAFSTVSREQDCNVRTSPVSDKYLPNQLDFQLHNIAVNCGRTPSPLKVDDVWRPW